MIYNDINRFKGDLKNAVEAWAEQMVDDLFAGRNSLKPVAYYMKNGIRNALDKYDLQLNNYIDTAVMFIGDSKGNIDADKVFDDLIGIFRSLEKQDVNIGAMRITYGSGEVVLHIPDNGFVNMLFPWENIKITADDLMEIKNMLV